MQKGVPLKNVLGREAIHCLAGNLLLAHKRFDAERFRELASEGLEPLELMQRGRHIARAMRACLPLKYRDAVKVILKSLTPEQTEADEFGLAELFYLPHSFFISDYGLDCEHNGGDDPFAVSMTALHALTTRFTAEYAIRPFLVAQPDRTLDQVHVWTADPNPHVRRLCSEGTRPRLPWGSRIPAFVADPRPTLPILETLKDDPSLYVRRSVANHLGDIAKDHPELVFEVCTDWLREGASNERKWLIRHAVRYPAKQGHPTALKIRAAAGRSPARRASEG